MFRYLRSKLIAVLSLTVIVLVVIAPVTSSAAPVEAAPQAAALNPPALLFSIAWPAPEYSGYLVRGGDNWVRYALQIYGWAWYTNTLRLVSYQGWSGNVQLSVLNLPQGVTSAMPASVFVPSGGSAMVPIRFLASTSAALATTTVTLRATSGSVVKTGDVRFSVVNQLPPLPPG